MKSLGVPLTTLLQQNGFLSPGVSGSSQTRLSEWSNLRVDWTNAVVFRGTWEYLGVFARSLEALMTSL